ncbi:amidohydrolase family protein [candidate division KSB1 bacterium]|nr:amidohydrolase family protein [candidate division KSB1 bacterium]
MAFLTEKKKMYTARILNFNDHVPYYTYFRNGAIIVNSQGKIDSIGAWKAKDGTIFVNGDEFQIENLKIIDFGDDLIIPGFVETHIHLTHHGFPISNEKLDEWLQLINEYAESRFMFTKEESASKFEARIRRLTYSFIDYLFSHGITSAAIYGPYNLEAYKIVWEVFTNEFGTAPRWILGLTIVSDKEAQMPFPVPSVKDIPQLLCQSNLDNSSAVFSFAPRSVWSCSDDLLQGITEILDGKYFVQSHLGETTWVREQLKKQGRDESDIKILEDTGILKAMKWGIFAHGVIFNDEEFQTINRYRNKLGFSHTPISESKTQGFGHYLNELDIKSTESIFNLEKYKNNHILWSLGVDEPWYYPVSNVLKYAKKIHQSHDTHSNAFWLYYYTLGGAAVAGLKQGQGSFDVGKFADFLVLDWTRITETETIDEMNSQDEEAYLMYKLTSVPTNKFIVKTFLEGKQVFGRDSSYA